MGDDVEGKVYGLIICGVDYVECEVWSGGGGGGVSGGFGVTVATKTRVSRTKKRRGERGCICINCVLNCNF